MFRSETSKGSVTFDENVNVKVVEKYKWNSNENEDSPAHIDSDSDNDNEEEEERLRFEKALDEFCDKIISAVVSEVVADEKSLVNRIVSTGQHLLHPTVPFFGGDRLIEWFLGFSKAKKRNTNYALFSGAPGSGKTKLFEELKLRMFRREAVAAFSFTPEDPRTLDFHTVVFNVILSFECSLKAHPKRGAVELAELWDEIQFNSQQAFHKYFVEKLDFVNDGRPKFMLLDGAEHMATVKETREGKAFSFLHLLAAVSPLFPHWFTVALFSRTGMEHQEKSSFELQKQLLNPIVVPMLTECDRRAVCVKYIVHRMQHFELTDEDTASLRKEIAVRISALCGDNNSCADWVIDYITSSLPSLVVLSPRASLPADPTSPITLSTESIPAAPLSPTSPSNVDRTLPRGVINISLLDHIPLNIPPLAKHYAGRPNCYAKVRPVLELAATVFEPLSLELYKQLYSESNVPLEVIISELSPYLTLQDGKVTVTDPHMLHWLASKPVAVSLPSLSLNTNAAHLRLARLGCKYYAHGRLDPYFRRYLFLHLHVCGQSGPATTVLCNSAWTLPTPCAHSPVHIAALMGLSEMVDVLVAPSLSPASPRVQAVTGAPSSNLLARAYEKRRARFLRENTLPEFQFLTEELNLPEQCNVNATVSLPSSFLTFGIVYAASKQDALFYPQGPSSPGRDLSSPSATPANSRPLSSSVAREVTLPSSLPTQPHPAARNPHFSAFYTPYNIHPVLLPPAIMGLSEEQATPPTRSVTPKSGNRPSSVHSSRASSSLAKTGPKPGPSTTPGEKRAVKETLLPGTDPTDMMSSDATPAGAEHGLTPLMAASITGHTAVVSLLLQRGAHLNMADTAGRTSLMWAARTGALDALEELLIRGAHFTVGLQDNMGRTALHHAVEGKQTATARALLESGAQVGTVDRRGLRPLDVAIQLAHTALVHLLIRFGASTSSQPLLPTSASTGTSPRATPLPPHVADKGRLSVSGFTSKSIISPRVSDLAGQRLLYSSTGSLSVARNDSPAADRAKSRVYLSREPEDLPLENARECHG